MFSKEQFTTVTPLSKALAMVVFILLPFAAFFLGMNYGRQTPPPAQIIVFPATDDVEEVDTLGWQTYRHRGVEFQYPPSATIVGFDTYGNEVPIEESLGGPMVRLSGTAHFWL